MDEPTDYEDLKAFILDRARMRMTHIYKPIMLQAMFRQIEATGAVPNIPTKANSCASRLCPTRAAMPLSACSVVSRNFTVSPPCTTA